MAKKSASVLDQICTAEEAAETLDLTPERVMQFCRAGRIEAKKLGRDWAILRSSVLAFGKISRPEGRPKESEK